MRSLLVPWQGATQTRRGTRTQKPPHKRQGMAAKVPATTRAGGEPRPGLPRGLGGTPTLPNPDLAFLASRTGTRASGTRLTTPGDHGTGTLTRAAFSSVTCTEAHTSLRVVRLVTLDVETGRQPRAHHGRLQRRSGGRARAGPAHWLAERRRASWRPHPAPPLCVRTRLSRARACAQNRPPPLPGPQGPRLASPQGAPAARTGAQRTCVKVGRSGNGRQAGWPGRPEHAGRQLGFGPSRQASPCGAEVPSAEVRLFLPEWLGFTHRF